MNIFEPKVRISHPLATNESIVKAHFELLKLFPLSAYPSYPIRSSTCPLAAIFFMISAWATTTQQEFLGLRQGLNTVHVTLQVFYWLLLVGYFTSTPAAQIYESAKSSLFLNWTLLGDYEPCMNPNPGTQWENESQAFANVTLPPCLGHPATAGIACASLLASTSGVDVGENRRAWHLKLRDRTLQVHSSHAKEMTQIHNHTTSATVLSYLLCKRTSNHWLQIYSFIKRIQILDSSRFRSCDFGHAMTPTSPQLPRPIPALRG